MNRFFALAFVVLGATFAALGPAGSGDAVGTVQAFYAALNTKQIDAAMALVAPDALFINPNGRFAGAAEIRASLEGGFKAAVTFDLANFRDTDGRVVYDYKVLVAGDVVETGTDGLTIVKDGKVAFDGTERTKPH